VIALASRFVCAADEVWRLQRGSEAECLFFQRAINAGERITDRGSRQGTWLLAPDGTLLARVGTRDPERVARVLEEALERWEALPDIHKRLPQDAQLGGHRWEGSFPVEGLVLDRVVRELEADGSPARSWNPDFAWFSAGEVRAMIPAGTAPGVTVRLDRLALRLARFHLVDNARGQTLPYAAEEVVKAELSGRVASRVGTQLVLVLEGHTDAQAGDTWRLGENLWTPRSVVPHGIECRLGGRAVYDTSTGRFTAFELVGVGRHWGRTAMNGRHGDPSPGRLAFHFQLAAPERRIAPAFIAVYDADWVERPQTPTWRLSPEEIGLEPPPR